MYTSTYVYRTKYTYTYAAHKYTDMRPGHCVLPAPAHTAQEEHHKEGESDYTWSCIAYIILSQIDDMKGHTQLHPQLKNWHHLLRGPVV